MISAHDFFRFLYPQPWTGLVFRPPTRPVTVVSTLEDGRRWRHHWRLYRRRAASIVRLYRDEREIFYSVALHDAKAAITIARDRRPGAHQIKVPPRAATAIALPALWVSLKPAPGCERDRDVLPGLLRAMPQPPSCVVATGSEFDVYWLLRAPWNLEAASRQAEAHRLLDGLQLAVDRRTRWRGFRVQKQNLGQRLRFPGTVAPGDDGPRTATVERLEDVRYDRGVFEPLALPSPAAARDERDRMGGMTEQVERDLIHGLHELIQRLGGRAKTTQILTRLAEDPAGEHETLRVALFESFPRLEPGELPSALSLGCKLRDLSGKAREGLVLRRNSIGRLGVWWKVERGSSTAS